MLGQLGVPVEVSHAGASHRDAANLHELEVPAGLDCTQLLVLLRDPRDTIVSGFHTAKNRRADGYPGSMSQFIRDPRHGIEKIIAFNLMWSELAVSRGDAALMTYEDLRTDTERTLSRVLAFFGAPRWPVRVRFTVWRNSFDRMQNRERSGRLSLDGKAISIRRGNDRNALKVRRGQVGGYRDELDPDDAAFCEEWLGRSSYFKRITSCLASSGL